MTEDETKVVPERRSRRRRLTDKASAAVHNGLSEKAVYTSHELRTQLRILVAMTVVLYIILALLVLSDWRQGVNNTNALCAIRRQAQYNASEGQTFLKAHPNGAFGFTAVQLQQSIDQELGIVTALDGLGC